MPNETQEEQIARCLAEMVEDGLVTISINEEGELVYSLTTPTPTE